MTDPPASEEQFRSLWKLYFLSLLGSALRILRLDSEPALKLYAYLEEAGLISVDFSLRGMLRAALDYARRAELTAELKINPVTGLAEGVAGKITLREPGIEQRKNGYVSADTLFEIADRALAERQLKFWIVLDRLDVAFAESAALEGNALRALFRVYRDLRALQKVMLKIFLRDDIWARITDEGFREASHVTESLTITWDSRSLLNLVIRRLLHNEVILAYYNVDPQKVLANIAEQEALFYRVFPRQVHPGEKKLSTLEWMLSRTTDGTGQPAPRELIHLLSSTRDQQRKALEMGGAEPAAETLFDRAALKAALPEVSKVRFEQTLCAEHPQLKPLLRRLEGEKTQQTPNSLAKIWATSPKEALVNAERLTEVGFFEKRATKEQPLYWVPFLYRDALNMVQGPAE